MSKNRLEKGNCIKKLCTFLRFFIKRRSNDKFSFIILIVSLLSFVVCVSVFQLLVIFLLLSIDFNANAYIFKMFCKKSHFVR